MNSSNAARVLVSQSNLPITFHLAVEQYLINTLPRLQTPQHILYMWKNDKTVVIGRHQNPIKECNLKALEQDNVYLARRYTGGGAVYQDDGNSCFSFISPSSKLRKEFNSNIILHALDDAYGIKGEKSGRNDLVYNGQKFSGAAYRRMLDVCIHHGTILRNVDINVMSRYLTPSAAKLKSKGVSSVASRVINLVDINSSISHEGICDAITRHFLLNLNIKPETVSIESCGWDHDLVKHEEFQKNWETLSNWDWRFGKSPQFAISLSTRFSWGSVDLYLDVDKGSIMNSKIFSDCLNVEIVDFMEDLLKDGCTFMREEILRRLKILSERIKLQQSQNKIQDTAHNEKILDEIQELGEWIASHVPSGQI